MRLAFGMSVVGSDGASVGSIACALFDPVRREVTHLVAHSAHLSDDVLVPLNLVQGSTNDRVLLHVTGDAFDDLPRYEAQRTELPPAHRVVLDSIGQAEDSVDILEKALDLTGRILELGPSTRVTTLDEFQGQLMGIAAEDTTYCLSEVIVRRLGRKRDCVIPAQWVTELRPGCIHLGAARNQVLRFVGVKAGPFVAKRRGLSRRIIER
jgi:hypothetical protein